MKIYTYSLNNDGKAQIYINAETAKQAYAENEKDGLISMKIWAEPSVSPYEPLISAGLMAFVCIITGVLYWYPWAAILMIAYGYYDGSRTYRKDLEKVAKFNNS